MSLAESSASLYADRDSISGNDNNNSAIRSKKRLFRWNKLKQSGSRHNIGAIFKITANKWQADQQHEHTARGQYLHGIIDHGVNHNSRYPHQCSKRKALLYG